MSTSRGGPSPPARLGRRGGRLVAPGRLGRPPDAAPAPRRSRDRAGRRAPERRRGGLGPGRRHRVLGRRDRRHRAHRRVTGPDAGTWWREGVLYQVYLRSYADGNADGIGDLRGLVGKLDYLAWLG